DGSIDWLCMPRFDSDACFAALLGKPEHGRWLIAPARKRKKDAPLRVTRHYRGDSLILETLFTTRTGSVRLIDFMALGTDDRSIVRVVEGVSGRVAMETELFIRFDYGVTVPWVNRTDSKTVTAVAGPHLLCIRTPTDLHGEDLRSVARFTVERGERVPFVMSYSPSQLRVPPVIDADIALEETEKAWKEWAGLCKLKGKWRNQTIRSLLTLKSLSYKPTGGIVAAVTTSLPERIGGTRNWDYRYCWLRDATFTLLAFLNAGYTEEANIWQNWLLRVIAGAPHQLQTMYNVMGEKRLDEFELPYLPGYENSHPVRVGNAAAKQLQLDIFGELADVLSLARKAGLPAAPRRTEIRELFLQHLEKVWRAPDEGIWEIRGAPQHFVHSKAMTWVAFDRAARSAPGKRYAAHLRKMADMIHRDVCAKGVDPKRGCFVQAYGSTALDASLLLLPLVGFLPVTDKRIRRTVEEIEKTLIHKGLVMRYQSEAGVDGLPPGEGAFLACSFWLADNYTLMGRHKDAVRLYNRLRRLANDVGLFAEEYDPDAKRQLGNFPQAFSHVALINTALNLMMQEEKRHNGRKKKRKRKRVVRY
ncbi:MAG TPA: glycoside hydrolase family 15 protein, partial [Rhizomicrobium sp.]|nr:glycoside hydrolase family 15 protein [Rhizomicrobium sp.]